MSFPLPLSFDASTRMKFLLTHVNMSEHIRAMRRHVINTRVDERGEGVARNFNLLT